MESQRSFLLIGLALVSFLLWQQWQKDYGPEQVQTVTQESNTSSRSEGVSSAVPMDDTGVTASSDVPSSDETAATVQPTVSGARIINVKTDTFALQIDLVGGDVVEADLVKYTVSQDSDEPYSLLHPKPVYIAQSGLVGANGPDNNKAGRPRYETTQTDFELVGDVLEVPLTWQSADGIQVTKTFTFKRDHHDIDITYTVTNNSGKVAQFQPYSQLQQSTEKQDSNMFMPTYRGAAYSTEDIRYEKYTFDDIADEKLRETTTGGWVAMLEHYFVSAWVPPQDQTNSIYSIDRSGSTAIIGYKGESVEVQNGEYATISNTLYIGPKDQDTLAQLARGLDLTVDYGILWWISQPLFTLLQFLHSIVMNWGVAIILITVIVKGSMYLLTKKQYESMAKMRNLAPKMQQLKDRFGDDRQKMSQAMMELYRKEKVNPMGGCLPLLLQMPIFLALYWVLLESVELRHAGFALWITDLSVQDPYFVLPILTGISMWMLQKLQPTTMTDPMQQKIMQIMPVAMSIFFFFFPAGLVLYWLVSNVITLVQAKMIYASMEKRGLKSK